MGERRIRGIWAVSPNARALTLPGRPGKLPGLRFTRAIRLDPWQQISHRRKSSMKNILGRKVGMTSVFTEDGRSVPVTVIAAGPCTVVERRTKEKHGYDAVALGFEPVKRSRVTRALWPATSKSRASSPLVSCASFAAASRTGAGRECHRERLRARRPRRRRRRLQRARLRGRHQTPQLQRRRSEPRLDDPSAARVQRRHQRGPHY